MELFISSKKAKFGVGKFDSRLNIARVDTSINARLALELKINLVFISPNDTHPTDRVVRRNGKSYAKDWDGNLYRILPWTDDLKKTNKEKYKQHGELFWSWNFWLQHIQPKYSGLDKMTSDMGAIRPAVDCTMEISFVDKNAHHKIFVYNLDQSATQFINKQGQVKPIEGGFSSTTWRSDAGHYDTLDWAGKDMKLFHKKTGDFVDVHHDTLGHELGHAIGQEHIMDLRYNKNKSKTSPGDSAYAGKTNEDMKNAMGYGDQITEVNAISWLERLAQHTKTKKSDWKVSMTRIAPRKLSMAEVLVP
jgi:hypothetical protein